MKKIFIFIIVCLSLGTQAQNTYYWYKNNQITLNVVSDEIFILVNEATDTTIVKNQLINKGWNVNKFQETNIVSVPLKSTSIPINYWTTAESVTNSSDLSGVDYDYYAPSYMTTDNSVIGVSHLFYVKLNSIKDFETLEKIADDNGVHILGHNRYMPLWYTLACDNSSEGNALQMANLFHETGKFSASSPDFINAVKLTCVNDNLFNNQWGLNNTGQNGGEIGIDINYCDAKSITQGSSDIVVAVVDEGVQLNHPDLNNMYHLSYDARYDTTPSVLCGPHGTRCAGIIGASANNNIHIAGIAPNSPIMSISNDIEGGVNVLEKLGNSILFATINGASIINNSWVSTPDNFIANMIENAIINGRNGKGCVVLASAGNFNNEMISFPANLDNVIAVGAISPCGERKSIDSCDEETWGSNFGTELSVVAPGVLIPTTNYASSYVNDFKGTSSACPHVAGVAALMLSVNPNLTHSEVKEIIETTAQKIRTDLYTYSIDDDHPNGSWNIQMGYGLVDAYAAVLKAKEMDLYVKDIASDNGSVPVVTDNMWNSPDIWIEDLLGNRVENPHGNTEYKVCVRIRNAKNFASTGTEKLFLNWAKAGVDLRWNKSWIGDTYFYYGNDSVPQGGVIGLANGITIPSIPANDSIDIKVTWFVPRAEDYTDYTEFQDENDDELWHFCLAARIHDGETIPNENTNNTSMGYFVVNSNNVAWKNLSVLHSAQNSAIVSVSNPHNATAIFRLEYNSFTNSGNEPLSKFADVYLTLDENLYDIWAANKYQGSGFRLAGNNRILLTGQKAVLAGISLPPNTIYTFKTEVQFYAQSVSEDPNFEFDIAQYGYDSNNLPELIGGESYLAIRNLDRSFEAEALQDATIFVNDPVTFTATPISENASYTWYDQSGNIVGTGLTLTVTPSYTQNYTLEVIADADGYKDTDVVRATVKTGLIVSLSPNPTSDKVVATYRLASNINNGQIRVVNTLGVLVYSTNVSSSQTETVLTVQNLTAGQYTVQLVSGNTILDSKSLIVQ